MEMRTDGDYDSNLRAPSLETTPDISWQSKNCNHNNKITLSREIFESQRLIIGRTKTEEILKQWKLLRGTLLILILQHPNQNYNNFKGESVTRYGKKSGAKSEY